MVNSAHNLTLNFYLDVNINLHLTLTNAIYNNEFYVYLHYTKKKMWYHCQ